MQGKPRKEKLIELSPSKSPEYEQFTHTQLTTYKENSLCACTCMCVYILTENIHRFQVKCLKAE